MQSIIYDTGNEMNKNKICTLSAIHDYMEWGFMQLSTANVISWQTVFDGGENYRLAANYRVHALKTRSNVRFLWPSRFYLVCV